MNSCVSRIVFYRIAILATLTRPHPPLCEDIPTVSFLRSTWSLFLLFRSSSIILILLIVVTSSSSKGTPGLQTQGPLRKLKEKLARLSWVLSRETLPEEIGVGAWSIAEFEVCHYLRREEISNETEPESRSSGKNGVWHFLKQRNNSKGNWRSLVEIEAWHLF